MEKIALISDQNKVAPGREHQEKKNGQLERKQPPGKGKTYYVQNVRRKKALRIQKCGGLVI